MEKLQGRTQTSQRTPSTKLRTYTEDHVPTSWVECNLKLSAHYSDRSISDPICSLLTAEKPTRHYYKRLAWKCQVLVEIQPSIDPAYLKLFQELDKPAAALSTKHRKMPGETTI